MTLDASTQPGTVIAVDGPSGSGKSTVSRRVASALGLRYLDTGAMYRALTWYVLDQGVDPGDADAVGRAAAELPLEITTDPAAATVVTVGGTDVSEEIRTPRIVASVSAVASVPAAREELVARQRAAIATAVREVGGMVAEGRDIGTVVAPDATAKIYLVADVAARAARRAAERHGDAVDAAAEAATAASIARRDKIDSTRKASPLTAAADAVEVDATYLGIEEVVDVVLGIVRRARGESD